MKKTFWKRLWWVFRRDLPAAGVQRVAERPVIPGGYSVTDRDGKEILVTGQFGVAFMEAQRVNGRVMQLDDVGDQPIRLAYGWVADAHPVRDLGVHPSIDLPSEGETRRLACVNGVPFVRTEPDMYVGKCMWCGQPATAHTVTDEQS